MQDTGEFDFIIVGRRLCRLRAGEPA